MIDEELFAIKLALHTPMTLVETKKIVSYAKVRLGENYQSYLQTWIDTSIKNITFSIACLIIDRWKDIYYIGRD